MLLSILLLATNAVLIVTLAIIIPLETRVTHLETVVREQDADHRFRLARLEQKYEDALVVQRIADAHTVITAAMAQSQEGV